MAQFTRQSFCQLLAVAIGNPAPPLWLSDWLGGWSANEIDVNQPYPAYNLFGCGEQWPGATDANSAGVKNYPNLGAGIAAMAQNLNSGLFNPLVAAIRGGDQNALITPGGGVTQSLHNWRAGPNSSDFSGYESRINEFIMAGAAHRNDTFQGPDGGGSSGGSGSQAAQLQCAAFKSDPTLYQACLLAVGNSPVQQAGNDITSGAGSTVQGANPLASVGQVFRWLQDRANWFRLAKIIGGVLLILTGLVLTIITVSTKAAESPAGQKVIGLASKAALA